MTLERTLFFIKPYIGPKKAKKIIVCRNKLYKGEGINFKVVEEFSVPNLDFGDWCNFYSQIKEMHPKVFNFMTHDFADCPYGLVGDVLEGENIIDGTRWILGSRKIEENPQWTIRGKYGTYRQHGKLWRTVAHSSTKDFLPSGETQVERDFRIFRNGGIINVSSLAA